METRRIVMTSTFYPPYHLGGDAVHVRDLAEELVRKGHEVHVVHSLDAFDLKLNGKRRERPGSDVVVHPLETWLGGAGAALTYLTGTNNAAERLLRDVVAEVRPDWVHHHNISLLGYKTLDVWNGPSMYTVHDHWPICPRSDLMYRGTEACTSDRCTKCSLLSGRPPRLWSGNALRDRLSKVEKIITPSEYMASVLRTRLGLGSLVLPNFVPRQTSSQTPHHGSVPHFTFVGVLEKHKGIDALLRTFLSSDIGAELHIFGKGSWEGTVAEASKSSNGRIRYYGFQERDVLVRDIRSAVALIAPSTCNENSPLSCIESLSIGTPLIVSSNGGLPELVRDPECGLVVDRIPDDLTPAVRELLQDEGRRNMMSKNALRRYEAHHSPESYIERYLRSMDGVA